MQRAFLGVALLLAPLVAVAGGDEFWSYSYRNVAVTAAGNSTYAVNLARYCVRLDGMLRQILGIRTPEHPQVHLYALPPEQVRQFLGKGDWVSFRITPIGDIVVMNNSGGPDSDYWGAYYGYTSALLASDGRLRGPDWYRLGLPLVFASTKYHGDRAQLGTVRLKDALTLGQGSALIPMRRFLSLKRATIFDDEATRKVYDAEAWALAHEVFVEGWHRAEFAKYLELMRQGSDEPAAFGASFNMTYEQLDKELAYAIRQRPSVYTLHAPDPGGGGEAARPLTVEEVKAQLAGLAAELKGATKP